MTAIDVGSREYIRNAKRSRPLYPRRGEQRIEFGLRTLHEYVRQTSVVADFHRVFVLYQQFANAHRVLPERGIRIGRLAHLTHSPEYFGALGLVTVSVCDGEPIERHQLALIVLYTIRLGTQIRGLVRPAMVRRLTLRSIRHIS